MDMKTKLVLPTLSYLPGWVSRMIEDSEKEVQDADTWRPKLLEQQGRKVVWVMCSNLGVNSNGVPGLACRLVERYLAIRSRMFFTFYDNERMGSSEWHTFKQSLRIKLPLIMASCIQLASKMTGSRFSVNSKVVRTFLLLHGISYSLAEVNNSEFQIYSYLGYRISLWTSVQVGEALAVLVGMTPRMMQSLELLINVSEYKRDILEKYVRWAASGFPLCQEFTGRMHMRTLHLVAGCVVAAAKYVKFPGPDPLPRMAEVTQAPPCYLRCVSDIILANAFSATPSTSRNLKRQRSSSES